MKGDGSKAGSSSRRRVRRRIGGGGAAAGGVDRISEVCDDVLLKILLLMPLVDAVRTSELSRRWAALWTRLPRLGLCDEDDYVGGGGGAGGSRFAGFVDSVLSRVAAVVPQIPRYVIIRVFKETNFDAARITSWASFVAAHRFAVEFHLCVAIIKVSELDSRQLPEEIVHLPCFETTKRISLCLLYISCRLALPTSGVFASLTELKLHTVQFSEFAGAAIGEVISKRCPCLEILEMETITGVLELTLHSTSLVHLDLTMVKMMELHVVAPKLQTVAVASCFQFFSSNSTAVSISAPKLQRVRWLDACPEQTHVGPIDRLHELVVGEAMVVEEGWLLGGVHSNFDMIMRHFSRTDMLQLRIPIYPEFIGHKQLMENIILPQHYSSLELVVEPNKHVFGSSMVCLLRRCHGLRALHVCLGQRKQGVGTTCLYCFWDHMFSTWRNATIRLNYLEELVIKDFNGTSHELDFLKFVCTCVVSIRKIKLVLAEGVIPTAGAYVELGFLRSKARSAECYFIVNQAPIRFM
ncbi:hypothetical protein GUJ93_ZPchr0013g37728 [Zizania palustris]|uniref:F-box domain-containing protein n=1 Tax=Zizania palustris TaxID=103762 RepID=A0A8J5X483_ZIZPA|nr:hypothetical protein GUJ93_ZPchr0013g37728 [Zizania palustris]